MRDLGMAAALAGATMIVVGAGFPTQGVRVVPNEGQRRVDVTIDGWPFTSYIWPT